LVQVLDLRDEHDFNLFHLGDARRVDPAAVESGGELRALLEAPATTVTFLVGNGEAQAERTWRRVRGQGAPNVYVLEGGMNGWLDRYPPPACAAERAPAAAPGLPEGDARAWRFGYATGATLPSAWPELPSSREFRFPCDPHLASGDGHPGHEGWTWPEHPFTKRVKLQTKSVVKGGCG